MCYIKNKCTGRIPPKQCLWHHFRQCFSRSWSWSAKASWKIEINKK